MRSLSLQSLIPMVLAVGCSPTEPGTPDGALPGADAESGTNDAAPVADLVPMRATVGVWTVETFETLTAQSVAMAADSAGGITLAALDATTASVVTELPARVGYALELLPNVKAPLTLARDDAGGVHALHLDGMNFVTYTTLGTAAPQSVRLETATGLRMLDGSTIAFSPQTGVVVFGDTLHLGTYERTLTAYRPAVGWDGQPLLTFQAGSSIDALDVDVSRTSAGLAALVMQGAVVSLHRDATAAASEVVITGFHAAPSLCIVGAAPNVVAADNHNTAFYDHLRVFEPTANTWTPRELDTATNTFFATDCAGTGDALFITDRRSSTASVSVLRVRGASIQRSQQLGLARGLPQVLTTGTEVHLAWVDTNGIVNHAFARAADL